MARKDNACGGAVQVKSFEKRSGMKNSEDQKDPNGQEDHDDEGKKAHGVGLPEPDLVELGQVAFGRLLWYSTAPRRTLGLLVGAVISSQRR